MIRDGARSSRRPPPKFEPFQATPRKSPLGRSEPGALSGGNGKPSRPQSKGRSRLGTPTGAPREEESEDGNGKEGVEEAEAGGEVEVDTHKGKEGNKKGKGGGKVGGVTPKGGPGGKGKSTPRVEETPTAEEKGSTPKEDGKGGSKQKAKGGAAKGAGRTPSDAKIESSGDATPAGEHKGKSGAKPKASPKSEPKPPSKSHKKQQPASKLERAKKTGGGNKASQAAKASSPGEDEHIEGGKKGKGVKRALESAAEPEKKKSHKKARR